MVTVPEATGWLAEVELVKVPNVARPAMLAAAPSAAADSNTFRSVRARGREADMKPPDERWGGL